MTSFTGTYKSTTLVGKNDTPVSGSVVKTPQSNTLVYNLVKDPEPPAGSPVDPADKAAMAEILSNSTFIKANNSKYTKTASKLLITVSDETDPVIVP